jgi:hypothetical protein
MLALKLQKLTTRTLLRPSQLRLVQGSAIITRTYKHGWKIIHNPKPDRKLPPMVPLRTHDRSPRVRSNERQGSNDREFEEESPEEEISLLKVLVAGFYIIIFWIITAVVEIFLNILAQKLGLIAPAPVPKDMMGVIGEENAMWLDQYMRENGEKKPGEDDER